MEKKLVIMTATTDLNNSDLQTLLYENLSYLVNTDPKVEVSDIAVIDPDTLVDIYINGLSKH